MEGVEVERFLREAFDVPPGVPLRDDERQKAAEVAALLDEVARIARGGRPRTLVDLGCGHAYLGLAAAALLPQARLDVVGVERDAARVRRCEEAADRLRARGRAVAARFLCAEIAEAPLTDAPDIVVALHACGPATDEAIEFAIASAARFLLVVPCCHRRPIEQPRAPRLGPLDALRRRAEQDLARAHRLEEAGYEVVAVEIWPPAISPANILLRARRTKRTALLAGGRS